MILVKRPLRLVILTLIVILATNSLGDAAVSTTPIDATALHQKLHARGIGKGLKVTEIDGTVVKGVLVAIDDASFQLATKNTTQPTRILDTQVSKISNDGMSTAAKVTIGVAVGVVILLVAAIISLRSGPKIAI